MDTTFIAQNRSDRAATAQVVSDAVLQPLRAQAGTRTREDDYECRERNCECRQRNGAPPIDWQLFLAAADLDN